MGGKKTKPEYKAKLRFPPLWRELYTMLLKYLCMVITFGKGKDQPGKVANPARGQLNRKNDFLPVPVRARKFGLARRFRPSRPASACSFSILRLNLMLTQGIPPAFRAGVHLFM